MQQHELRAIATAAREMATTAFFILHRMLGIVPVLAMKKTA
jgi:hypothetical protein